MPQTGGVGIYPDRDQVSIVGRENTTDYQFGKKYTGTPFCTRCGVSCFGNNYGPPQEIRDRICAISEEKKQYVERMLRIQAVNIRVLDDVEWDAITVLKEDDGTEGYALPN